MDRTKDSMKLSAIEKRIMMIRSPRKPVVAADNEMLLARKQPENFMVENKDLSKSTFFR